MIRPGDTLRDMLTARNVTQQDLARAMHVSLLTISELINHWRRITPTMALRLEKALPGMSAWTWLQQQQLVDLELAREKLGTRLEKVQKIG